METPASRSEKAVYTLLGFLFVAFTTVLSFFTAEEVFHTVLLPSRCARVPYRVLERRIDINPGKAQAFSPVVRYEYEWEGKVYRSERLWPLSHLNLPQFNSREEATFKVADILGKEPALAYVPRHTPEKAFLDRLPTTPLFVLIAVNLVLVLIAPVVLLTLLRRYRAPRPERSGRSRLVSLSSITVSPYWAHIPTLTAVWVLAASFVGGTGWMLYRGLYLPYALTEAALSWKPTTCRVLEVFAIPDPEGSPHQTILVEYEYPAEGKILRGSRYDFYQNTMPSKLAARVSQDLSSKKGLRVPCYYDPAQPSQVVIHRSWKYPVWQETLVLTIAFSLSVVFLFTFLTLWIRRITRRSRSKFDLIPVTEGARHQADSITTRRRFKAVLGICLSLLLTGLSYLWLGTFWSDAFAWHISFLFTTLSLPLLALTGFVYSKTWTALRQLSAPAPRMAFPKRAAPPGGSLEIRWELDAPAGQVASLTFELRGKEIAVAGEGEDIDTFVQPFYRHRDTRLAGPDTDLNKGGVTFVIPSGAPASFDGKFNHVRWEVGLEMVLKDDESLTESFDVQVLPPGGDRAPS